MTFDVRTVNLKAVNSLTKYPSIPTYHQLDPKNGGLLDESVPFTNRVIATEKVDGTNSRVILLPDGSWLLGSREELLHAKGDLIFNPSQGIVEALRDLADRIPGPATDIVVYYLELYGHKIGAAAKHYTTRPGQVGWRLFDVSVVPADDRLTWPSERIAAWREGGGQHFVPEHELAAHAGNAGVDLTPRLFEIDAAALPTDLDKTKAFLDEHLPATLVALDGATPGRSEGIVLRTVDRSVIAKARFQDYERTLKRRR